MKTIDLFNEKNNNVSTKEVENFLDRYNILLSEEYISLLENNILGKIKEVNKIIVKRIFDDGFEQDFYLDSFSSFDEFKDSYLYFHIVNIESQLVESGVSIIGMTNGRTCICIGIHKKNLGQIFLWDGDFGVTFQANSLNDFFDSLTVDE